MVGVYGQWKLTVNYIEKFSMIQQPKRITAQYKRSADNKSILVMKCISQGV